MKNQQDIYIMQNILGGKINVDCSNADPEDVACKLTIKSGLPTKAIRSVDTNA